MPTPATDVRLLARFARTELIIEHELPSAVNLPDLIVEMGLDATPQETMWVVTLDSLAQARTVVEIARGGYHEIEIPMAALLSIPLIVSTDRMIVVHNHPAGDVTPTRADLDMTRKVMAGANICGIYLDDSVVIGPNGQYFSMVSNGLIAEPKDYAALARSHQRVKVRR